MLIKLFLIKKIKMHTLREKPEKDRENRLTVYLFSSYHHEASRQYSL